MEEEAGLTCKFGLEVRAWQALLERWRLQDGNDNIPFTSSTDEDRDEFHGHGQAAGNFLPTEAM